VRIPQLIVTVVVAGGSLSPSARVSAQDPAPVPLSGEPRHHVVYESPSTRIHDIQIPPGDTTLFHTHDTAILYVPIARSTTRSQVLGGEWGGGGAAPAAVAAPAPVAAERPGRVNSVTTYVEKPYTHRVNNLGTSLFRLVGIANRTAGANGAADDVSGLSATPELENNWYRAHRVVIKPGGATPVHKHATRVVVVMQTPGTAVSESPAWSPINGPGDYAWHTGAGEHVVRNRGANEIELVEIEVRGAGQ
jgi:quercetin dioxygenase-like cupin family protein